MGSAPETGELAPGGDVTVQRVDPRRTLALRQQVLRPKLAVEEMTLFDDGPEAATYAAIDVATSELLCTATVLRADPKPGLETVVPAAILDRSWRLRGMATREDLRSRGLGRRVLSACIDHVAESGGGLLWCDARVGARTFYARAGFVEFGGEFVSQEVPHIAMWRTVGSPPTEEDA